MSRLKISYGIGKSIDVKLKNYGNGKHIVVIKETRITFKDYKIRITITAVTDDGWLHIYVANDILYINQQNETFQNKSTNELITKFSMLWELTEETSKETAGLI